MAAPARKFNPGFLTDDELVASYCVRTAEFELLVEVLRDCTGPSNPHQLVIGPRGSGKTTLLLRVAAEVPRDDALASRCFPVVFAEESYDVATAGEFWLECLTNVAAQAPGREDAPDLHRSIDELRTIRDDRALADRCLGALLDFAEREDKRLLLLVENLNMLFRDMADPDEGWRLRKTLQTEPRIIVFASATSRFEEIDHPDRALYDLFRIRTLRPLDTKQCATLWEMVTGRHPAPQMVRSLEILTGGSPRLISIVARFGAGLSFRELMADVFDLVDDHTEYFKSHIESLPAQERRVYLALATLWKPATTREIADHARLETSTCSAQLARLGERGVVQVAGGTARRKQYYLTERLYNIYYLLRRRRGPDRLVEALIHFMESYYSPPELKDIGARMVRDAGSPGAEMGSLHRIALASLMKLPSLAEYRDELLAMMPAGFVLVSGRDSVLADLVPPTTAGLPAGHGLGRSASTDESTERAARELFETTAASDVQNRTKDAVEACDEVVGRFGDSENCAVLKWVARALENKGAALRALNRPQDALEASNEVIRRFGESETLPLLEPAAKALVNKGVALSKLDRPQDALAVYDEVVSRFAESESAALLEPVAKALVNKAGTLGKLNRPREALTVCDVVIRRFGKSETPALLEPVASALANKSAALSALNRPQEALTVCDEVIRRFGESETAAVLEAIANTLLHKAAALGRLNRPQEALAVCDEAVRRFGECETPALRESVAKILANQGAVLHALSRPEDALAIYDEVVRRFGESEAPAVLESVATALVNKGVTLDQLNRAQDALTVCDEVVDRFGESEAPALLEWVATALANKGIVLLALNRPADALTVYDDVVGRFGENEAPALLESVAKALANKGFVLGALNRPADAIEACEVVQRFGESEIPVLIELAATALLNKGAALQALNRLQEALTVYDEVVQRFGESETAALIELAATALLNKGSALRALSRPQDALTVYDEVVRRFRESEAPALLESVAQALANKAVALGALSRPRDALEVCNEVVRRFGKSETPALLGLVMTALLNKGSALQALNRPQDALEAWNEVVRRFRETDSSALSVAVVEALLRRADIEVKSREYEKAAETTGQLIDGRHRGSAEQRFRGLLIRARALLAAGDRPACEQDVEAAFVLLPELGVVPRDAIMALMDFSVDLEPHRMLELIQASPSARRLLLPLTTALERELGHEPRVAREVDEVARDIQQTLATLRANRSRRQQERDG